MRLIPVHIVSGGVGSGKSALIARMVKAGNNWLGLVNSRPSDADRNLQLLSSGCPCCTGRVVLQITLARTLRETKAERAFVELTDAGHAAKLQQLLAVHPFSLSMCAARSIVLPQDVAIRVSDFDG